MADNPYAAPQTADLVRPTDWSTGSGTFTIGQCFNDAWQAATKNIGLVIGGYLVAMFAMLGFAITIVGIVVAIPVMVAGLQRFGLEVLDGESRIGTLFSGFSDYGKWLGRMLLLVVAMYVLSLPGSAIDIYSTLTENDDLVVIGFVVSMVWSLGFMIRFTFAYLFAVDRDQTAFDALRSSWQVSGRVWFKLILLTIVAAIVGASGVILLGVGLLFTAPLAALMFVSAYRQVAGRPAPVE